MIVDTGPKGLFGAYNRLFTKATGDYCIVVPNDTIIQDPEWLQKLAVPNKVTSWSIGTWHITGNREPDGGVTCYPRDIFDKVGWYDEQFDAGYGCGDNDWFHRATLMGIEYEEVPVKLTHNGNTTYQTYWNEFDRKTMGDLCINLFKKKWKL